VTGVEFPLALLTDVGVPLALWTDVWGYPSIVDRCMGLL